MRRGPSRSVERDEDRVGLNLNPAFRTAKAQRTQRKTRICNASDPHLDPERAARGYVGAAVCGECHRAELDLWKGSAP
jgi:hypothetical protein